MAETCISESPGLDTPHPLPGTLQNPSNSKITSPIHQNALAWTKRSAPQNKRGSGCCHILRRIFRTAILSFVSSPPPTLRQTLLQHFSHKAPPKSPFCTTTMAPTSPDGTSSTIKRRSISTIHPPIYVSTRGSATNYPRTPAYRDDVTHPDYGYRQCAHDYDSNTHDLLFYWPAPRRAYP